VIVCASFSASCSVKDQIDCPSFELWLFKGNAAFNGGRIGAKASRVIRMIPLVRLVKLGKVTFQRSRGKDLPVMGIINTRFARFVPT